MVPQRIKKAKEQSIVRGYWMVNIIKDIDQELSVLPMSSKNPRNN